MRWWPRTIRWKMLLGLVLLEALSITLFALLLVRLQSRDLHEHARQRLTSQVSSVASQAQEAMLENHSNWLASAVRMMGKAPSVSQVKVTDQAGNVLVASPGVASKMLLDPIERAQMSLIHGSSPRIFTFGKDRWEGVEPIYFGTKL